MGRFTYIVSFLAEMLVMIGVCLWYTDGFHPNMIHCRKPYQPKIHKVSGTAGTANMSMSTMKQSNYFEVN